MKKTKTKYPKQDVKSSDVQPKQKRYEYHDKLKVVNGFRIWEKGYKLREGEIINHHPEHGLVVRRII